MAQSRKNVPTDRSARAQVVELHANINSMRICCKITLLSTWTCLPQHPGSVMTSPSPIARNKLRLSSRLAGSARSVARLNQRAP